MTLIVTSSPINHPVDSDQYHKKRFRKSLSACPSCDLVIKRHNMAVNQYSVCPRCHSKVEHKHSYSEPFLKWTVMAALLFYIPANFYPLVVVEIAGSVQETSILNGIIILIQQEQLVPAAIVMFCSLLVPLLVITTFTVLLVSHNYNVLFKLQKFCVRLLLHLRDWSMMDIYLISFFVTMIKLHDMGDVQLQIGLLACVGLTVCINKLFISYDRRALWQLITKHRANDQVRKKDHEASTK
ncbi:MAG: paraquat-inducible protein A [Phenylobacterium sp.]|jgi:paraquat-inducible protein A